MKKLAYTAALAVIGLSLSVPAMAAGYYGNPDAPVNNWRQGGVACKVDADGERHCWNRVHRWHRDRQFVSQDGQDVNSNTWSDGSARATLPPHNSRGTSRPDTGDSFQYDYQYNW
jgi:hypothetical protein